MSFVGLFILLAVSQDIMLLNVITTRIIVHLLYPESF